MLQEVCETPAGGVSVKSLPELAGQRVHVASQTALQVGCLVTVDVTFLRETVHHAHDFGQDCFCLFLVFQFAVVLDCSVRRFLVVTVLQTTLLVLADALEC